MKLTEKLNLLTEGSTPQYVKSAINDRLKSIDKIMDMKNKMSDEGKSTPEWKSSMSDYNKEILVLKKMLGSYKGF